MSIEIVPTNAVLGAEIRGVDLARPLDEATFCEIERAFNTNAVIFFRDQRITPPQQVAFTRRFGEIEFNVFGERWSVPGSPEIVVVPTRQRTAAQSASVAPARTGIAICATRPGRHGGPCSTLWKSPTYSALPSVTPNSPMPPRRGTPCPSQSNSGSTGDARCLISVAASVPSHPPGRNRPLSAGQAPGRPDASQYRAQVPVRDA